MSRARKPKFRAGQFVVVRSSAAGMPTVVRIDSGYCQMYSYWQMYTGTHSGPVGDIVASYYERELRPLTARERGPSAAGKRRGARK